MQCQAEGMVHLSDKQDEMLAALKKLIDIVNSARLDVFSTSPSPVSGTIFQCITVMDAMGREHKIPLEFSFSYDVCGLSALCK